MLHSIGFPRRLFSVTFAMLATFALVSATGADPWLLAMAASMAASWGFMLPSGTGPNAIAWATDHIALPKMLRAGFLLDLAGIPLLVGTIWLMGNIIQP